MRLPRLIAVGGIAAVAAGCGRAALVAAPPGAMIGPVNPGKRDSEPAASPGTLRCIPDREKPGRWECEAVT